MERKLAAVLSADVAGYSRLMCEDEEGTHVAVKAHLAELVGPTVAAHGGRIVKTTGDGVLAEFPSVVEAVACAADVERAMPVRNAGVPDRRRIMFRIGVSLGDVIVEPDDIYGEGVNLAVRLQELATPGGICVSGDAFRHVKGRTDLAFEDLGDQKVKNFAEPVRVYRVLVEPGAAERTIGPGARQWRSWRWLAAAAAVLVLVIAAGTVGWWRPWERKIEPASIARMALPLPDRPSIAVLPFANMSDDPKQEYFADGITDDLITELSKVSGLFVISRNSTFVYKAKTVPAKQVSEELGVRYVLEGSVQRAGDRLRINAQLIDALSGGHEWADRFDGSLADVFALQDKVARSIADALAIRLTAAEQQFIGQQETNVPAAYDAFLRGWEHFRRGTPDDYAKAIPYFVEAIKLDPKFGRAYAALALVYFGGYDARWNYDLRVSDMEALGRGARHLEVAQKHPTALSHQAAGLMFWAGLQQEEALVQFKDAITLDPGDPLSYAYIGGALTSAGRPAEAVPYIRMAMRLDPYHPPLFDYFLGLAQFGMGNFEAAAVSFDAAARLNPGNEYPFAALAAAYGHLGRKQDASAAIARYNDLRVGRGDVPITIAIMPWLGFRTTADLQRLRTGLRLAGVPESLSSGEFATQNRLSADEIRTLFFGHRLHGQDPRFGEERTALLTTDGVAELSGDWVLGGRALTGGITQFNGDDLCLRFDVVSYCGPVFRNPGGTRAAENEFIWLVGEAFTFSQVE